MNKSTITNTERNAHIDVFKSIGIICMIMGHTSLCPLFLAKYFVCFYMPMFFWISGFLFHKYDLKKSLAKKAKNLLIPYLESGIVCLIISALVMKHFTIEKYLVQVYAVFFCPWSDDFPLHASAIWFLLALFWTEVIFRILHSLNNKYVLYTGCLILFVLGIFWRNLFSFQLWWSIDTAFVGVGFMCLGYIFSQNKETKIVKWALNLPVWCTIISFVINYYLARLNTLSMWRNFYTNKPLFIINSIMGICIWFTITKWISDSNNGICKKIVDFLSYIGRNSIVFLCTNQIVIYLIKHYIIKTHFKDVNKNISFIVIFLATMCVIFLLSYIRNELKIKKSRQ